MFWNSHSLILTGKITFFSDQTLQYIQGGVGKNWDAERGLGNEKRGNYWRFLKKKVQTSIRHNMADEQNEESLVPLRCVVKV